MLVGTPDALANILAQWAKRESLRRAQAARALAVHIDVTVPTALRYVNAWLEHPDTFPKVGRCVMCKRRVYATLGEYLGGGIICLLCGIVPTSLTNAINALTDFTEKGGDTK